MPETLATIRHWAGQCSAFDWTSIGRALRVPESELLQSPISAKIAVMGFNDGRVFHHHEGRGIIPVHPSRAPDFESADVEWSQGRLVLPKYASFALESASPPFNPNHRCKWRPHELLHSLCRFYWRPDMTRFEAYIGARLSELLPVVHWYGLDELYRRRCPIHVGQVLYRDFCPECESLAQESWQINAAVEELLRRFCPLHSSILRARLML